MSISNTIAMSDLAEIEDEYNAAESGEESDLEALDVRLDGHERSRQFVNVRGVGHRVAYPTQVWKRNCFAFSLNTPKGKRGTAAPWAGTSPTTWS